MRAIALSLFIILNLRLGAQTISDFSLTNAVDESIVSLSSFNGAKGIALIFTSNNCPYAKLYEDRILDLYRKYVDSGLKILLINSNNPESSPEDELSKMKTKAMSKGYPFPYLADKSQEISKLLGARKNPEVFLLKPAGSQYKVVYKGSIDDNPQNADDVTDSYLKEAIELLIRNKPVPKINNRPVGCMIKT